MRLLTIDIETRPLEAYAWGLWDQNIGINQIKDPGGLLCVAAKFHDERRIHFHSEWEDGEKGMVKALHRLLDEADVVVGWNSDKFDLRWLASQFLKHGLSRPSPFTRVDLLKSVRRQVMLPSYKLDFVAQFLEVGKKIDTGGFELWRDVLNGCPKARAKMKRYNCHDTRLTEAVFDKLNARGWVLGLPNASIEDGICCPNPLCRSEKLQSRGYNISKTRRYRRYKCIECGTWIQSTKCEPGSAQLKPSAP